MSKLEEYHFSAEDFHVLKLKKSLFIAWASFCNANLGWRPTDVLGVGFVLQMTMEGTNKQKGKTNGYALQKHNKATVNVKTG